MLYAVDTETCLFEDVQYGAQGKTRISPFKYPALVLVTTYDGKDPALYRRDTAERALLDLLARPDTELVFHNIAFDFGVLNRFSPAVGSALLRLAGEGRIHDTALLELLVQIARGDETGGKGLRTSKLSKLALNRAGMRLNKDDGIRLTFDRYINPNIPLPDGYYDYATQDAVATYKVYQSQAAEAEVYASGHNEAHLLPNYRRDFGLLTEALQVRAALAHAWLEQHPMRVDLDEARALNAKVTRESKKLEDALIQYGWATRGPKTGRFHLSNVALAKVLDAYSKEKSITPDYTPTGKISLSDRFWNDWIPRIPEASLIAPEGIFSIQGRLQVWLRYLRVRKLKGTFLDTYGASSEHYPTYYILGARTGRASCVRPNAQQVPKHRDGLRSLFVPSKGRVFIEADFKGAELVSLAQIYHLRYGGSLLGESINSGIDAHEASARRVYGANAYDAAPPADQKKLRQAAKALNFGIPGGLGYRRFVTYAGRSFGVALSEEQSRALINAYRESDPQLSAYLADGQSPATKLQLAAQNLGATYERLISALDAWRDEEAGTICEGLAVRRLYLFARGDYDLGIPLPPGFNPLFDLFRSTAVVPTGRIRGRCSFTEAHNTPFQGLISDAIKCSLWHLYTTWADHPALFSPVCAVHDSVLVECLERDADTVKSLLESSMLHGLRTVCPAIKGEVDIIGPLDRWGASTSAFGEAT